MAAPRPVANFRMYSPVLAAAEAWRALFGRVFVDAGLDLDIIEHAPPARLADLYKRDDLACAFMCGWPFARHGKMQAIASLVPAPERYEHQSRYCSEIVVPQETGWTTIEETFGHRFGWTSAESQSGYNAPRAFLSRFVTPERPELYGEVRGPLGAPMSALDALLEGEVDVTSLDSFWLDLLRRHAPAKAEGITTVATTPWTPMPLLVASPAVDARIVSALRQVLLRVHEQPGYVPFLADVLIERFVAPDVAAYASLEAMAQAAEGVGAI